ncbi:universal stress protein [Halobium salinum]|uniref:Universal stress protein n=1 Tax=Halobium salinum TaxID=1364940 RepID=A0ABD5PF00_9EURY|nr:universal stress protein [Halobium salinum]
MYEHILLPTDGSESAEAAIDHAIDLAVRYDATLHVLYVVDTAAFGDLPHDTSVVLEGFEEVGRAAVERVADRARETGVPVETDLVHGLPRDEIVDYVEAEGIDLVVMGTHGRTGLGRMVLGSTTERVVRRSPVPVVTVRHPESNIRSPE